jgi:hypothetical protein
MGEKKIVSFVRFFSPIFSNLPFIQKNLKTFNKIKRLLLTEIFIGTFKDSNGSITSQFKKVQRAINLIREVLSIKPFFQKMPL